VSGLRYRTVAELAPNAAAALLTLGLALADTKHRLGQRLSEWVNGAPALEAAVGASAMTQDELGHARSLFAMLRDFPGAPPELRIENDLERSIYFNPTLLETQWGSWMDVIAANVLLDQALTVIFEAAFHSGFAPLSQRAAKVLQEERFHRIFGEGWLDRLAATGGQTRERLQAALDRMWPVAAAWFGPPDDPVVASLLEEGILSTSARELRAAWLARVAPLMQKHDLPLPAEEPDWSWWDPERRQVFNG